MRWNFGEILSCYRGGVIIFCFLVLVGSGKRGVVFPPFHTTSLPAQSHHFLPLPQTPTEDHVEFEFSISLISRIQKRGISMTYTCFLVFEFKNEESIGEHRGNVLAGNLTTSLQARTKNHGRKPPPPPTTR